MERAFEIRTYGYNELARLYFPFATPHSATVMLRRWILRNKKLMARLQEKDGLTANQKTLTPFQVRVIVEFFGEPG